LPNHDGEGHVVGITCIVLDIREDEIERATSIIQSVVPHDVLARLSGGSLAEMLATPPPASSATTSFGGVLIDNSRHGLLGPVAEVRLTRIEWLLLQQLIQSQGEVISRESLLGRVWGSGYAEYRLLHDTISRLRHRFQEAGLGADPIETVYGIGYRLVNPPS
jgi:DNA-binding response OmpR family regulator